MNSKHKALTRIQKEDSNKPKNERRIAHKAIGGTLYFPNPKSSGSKKHEKSLQEWRARGKNT